MISTMRNVTNYTLCEMSLLMMNNPSVRCFLVHSTKTELTEKGKPLDCVSHIAFFVTPILIPTISQGIMVYLVCGIIAGIKFKVGKSDLVNSRPFPIC